MSNRSADRRTETTVPQPFNLTQPKPKVIEQPIFLKKIEVSKFSANFLQIFNGFSNKKQAQPVPKEKYAQHENLLKQLEKRKDENKKNLEEKFKSFQAPQFLNEPRPSNKEKVSMMFFGGMKNEQNIEKILDNERIGRKKTK